MSDVTGADRWRRPWAKWLTGAWSRRMITRSSETPGVVKNSPVEKRTKRPTWTTRDGRELLIEDMEDSHLVNTIRFLRRRTEAIRQHSLRQMSAYMATAPDGAFDACEREADQLIDADGDDVLSICEPAWEYLLAEARKRNLHSRDMACPTCGSTMANLGVPGERVFHCSRCGTVKVPSRGDVYVPRWTEKAVDARFAELQIEVTDVMLRQQEATC